MAIASMARVIMHVFTFSIAAFLPAVFIDASNMFHLYRDKSLVSDSTAAVIIIFSMFVFPAELPEIFGGPRRRSEFLHVFLNCFYLDARICLRCALHIKIDVFVIFFVSLSIEVTFLYRVNNLVTGNKIYSVKKQCAFIIVISPVRNVQITTWHSRSRA